MPVASSCRLLLLSLSILVILAGIHTTPVSAAAPHPATTSMGEGSATGRPTTAERDTVEQVSAKRVTAKDRAERKKKKRNKKKCARKARRNPAITCGKGDKGGNEGAPPTGEPTTGPTTGPQDDQGQPATDPVVTETGTYFVDPQTGSDDNSGTSATSPWRTLTRASRATLAPGESLLLRAGTQHVGSLLVTEDGTQAQPVRISSYGEGHLPVVSDGDCVRLQGDWLTVSDVHAEDCHRAGFHVEGADITVRAVEASGSVAGVWVRPGALRATVTESYLHDNTMMAPGTDGPDDDYGAFGVEVNGDHTRVLGNRISGHVALSPDYGKDGAAVEVYQAVGTLIQGNVSTDDLAFTELGGSTSRATRVFGNTVTSDVVDAAFLMTRGPGQVWGPVTDTVAEGNVVTLTGEGSFGFGCYGGCTADHLVMRGNTISAGWYVGWVDGSFVTTGNTYRGELWFTLGSGDVHLG